jgi:hypothetical protein
MGTLAEARSNRDSNGIDTESKQKLAKIQVPFIQNTGQSFTEVKFTARTFAGTVSVTEKGYLVYSLPKLEGEKPVAGVVLKEELIGGKVKEVKGESQSVTKVSYFHGTDRSKWQSNQPSYDRVSLGEVYKGIDVEFKAYGNNLEKLFCIHPGADPQSIRIKLTGGKRMKVNSAGELEIETDQGTVRFSTPIAFQEQGGRKESVEIAYALHGDYYGFRIGNYDHQRELVIDPTIAATFLGGDWGEEIHTLAVDAMGDVYVSGYTWSIDFLDPGSGIRTNPSPFVVKLNSDLSSVLAVAVVDGGLFTGLPFRVRLAVDGHGDVFVAGTTVSNDFPGISPDSADSFFAGMTEGFVAKLTPDLDCLLAATFLGGNSLDELHALCLDSNGNVYVTGTTASSDPPGIDPGSADKTPGVLPDAFVASLSSDLSSIIASTFLGGSSYEEGRAIAVDATGDVYVAGETGSSDFPGIGPQSADSTISGCDAFVTKLSPDLKYIQASTFLGGGDNSRGTDRACALGIDHSGNIYVAGTTDSVQFPGITPNSAQSTVRGGDAFLAKLNPNLSSILAATFVGGGQSDVAEALSLDSSEHVYIADWT